MLWLFLIIGTGAALVALAVWAWTVRHITRQTAYPHRLPLEQSPSSVGLDFEEVSFTPRGSFLQLRGWFIPAEQEAKGSVVFAHGIGGNRTQRGRFLKLAVPLHQAGFHLLQFDFRAHGESEGESTSLGHFEVYDLLGALDFMVTTTGVPWERLGVLGVSLGAAAAILAAGHDPRIRAVVADSPFARLGELVHTFLVRRVRLHALATALRAGIIALARLRYRINLMDINPVAAIAWLAHPVLLIHGDADRVIPAEHSRLLLQAANDPATELWLAPGADHVEAWERYPDEYAARVISYLTARFEDATGESAPY